MADVETGVRTPTHTEGAVETGVRTPTHTEGAGQYPRSEARKRRCLWSQAGWPRGPLGSGLPDFRTVRQHVSVQAPRLW